jgi:hypothetical protein
MKYEWINKDSVEFQGFSICNKTLPNHMKITNKVIYLSMLNNNKFSLLFRRNVGLKTWIRNFFRDIKILKKKILLTNVYICISVNGHSSNLIFSLTELSNSRCFFFILFLRVVLFYFVMCLCPSVSEKHQKLT